MGLLLGGLFGKVWDVRVKIVEYDRGGTMGVINGAGIVGGFVADDTGKGFGRCW